MLFHKQYFPMPHHLTLTTSSNITQEQGQGDDTTTTTTNVTKSQNGESLNQ